MKNVFLFILLIFISGYTGAQDINYARKLIDTLASDSMHGRGYAFNGDNIAAEFIENEFKSMNLKPFCADYRQYYNMPMNVLDGKAELAYDNKKLIAGKDFVVWAASPDINGQYEVVHVKIKKEKKLNNLFKLQGQVNNKIVVIDKTGITDKKVLNALDSLKYYNFLKAKGLIFVSDKKPMWSVMIGFKPRGWAVIDVNNTDILKAEKISLNIESTFNENYRTSNVAAYVKGKKQPDTFLIVTAHYDHLGQMGDEAIFPGANDNASGTSMVLDLAKHFSQYENRPDYSIAFILFSGEEAGLKGSNYMADHFPVSYYSVKSLVNLDMVGTGSDGVTVVNGTIFNDIFNRFDSINKLHNYVKEVKARGESCNSDHCPFSKKGIPSVFIYSMGKEFTEYHNVDDVSYRIPLTDYEDIFRLVHDFLMTYTPN